MNYHLSMVQCGSWTSLYGFNTMEEAISYAEEQMSQWVAIGHPVPDYRICYGPSVVWTNKKPAGVAHASEVVEA